ncbi:carbohydrate kinase family protein [archaeon]|nr:carbohydrate kinase family protein [archaeon]
MVYLENLINIVNTLFLKRGKMFDIVTVGSALVDVFVNTELGEIKKDGKKLIAYPVGSKISVKSIKFLIGGGGTNTAVSFSRLGFNTGYLGKIGNDKNGEEILDLLKKEGINFVGVRGGTTGYSVILDSKEHNRTVLTHKGASDELKYGELSLKKLKTKWFYFSSMLNDSLITQKNLIKLAAWSDVKIAFNPSMYQIKKDITSVKNILKKTDILILNKEEATLLVKKRHIEDLLECARLLGPKIVCITDGRRNTYAYNGFLMYTLKPHDIKIKERTGAGDAFASGFVAGFIKKDNLEFALQMGLANAESVVKYFGSKNKLLKWKEALKKIEKNPGKITKKEL